MTPEELEAKHLTGEFKLRGDFLKNDELRDTLITRCEQYAGWTLPYLFPDENYTSEELQYDYQSVGAQAVIHLANKVMMALFQPSQPFFRLDLTDKQRQEIKESANLSDAQIEKAIADGERDTMKLFRRTNNRPVLIDALMLLIITGNCLVEADTKKGMKYWSLHDYQVQRDLSGKLLNITFRETKALSTLPDDIAALARSCGVHDENAELTIYTGVRRVGENKYIVWQELEDLCYIHNQFGVYTEDTLPWLALVWNKSRDRDYGTGMIENYAGAFHTLSTLSEAALDYTTIVTDLKNLVDPTGMTDVATISESPSGAYVPGREEDIFVHTPQVGDATQFLETRIQAASRQIAAAFLMNSQVVRDAERVTAEEVRMVANELEGSLGGVYSRLGIDLQLPLAKRYSTAIDPLFGEIEPEIITGLESLSRTSDLDRIRFLFQDLQGLAELPERIAERIDFDNIIKILGAGHQVEYEQFLLEEKQVQANRKQNAEQLAVQEGMTAEAVNSAQGQA